MMPGRSRFSPIGLDVGARAVKAIQLAHTRKGPVVHAAANFPRIAAGEEVNSAELIRAVSVLRRQGFTGDLAVVCIPPSRMLSGVIELPARSPGAPLDMIARQELARACRKEPGAIELAWWDLPTGAGVRAGQATQALAIGCAHIDSESLLARFEPCALDILAIDARPAALTRACAPWAAETPNLTAVLDLGYSAAEILILVGRTLVYERTLAEASLRLLASGVANKLSIDEPLADYILREIGCAEIDRVVDPQGKESGTSIEQAEDARALVCAHADALAGELRTSMSYAARRFDGSLTRVLLCGAGAEIPGLCERIGQRTGAEARVARVDSIARAASHVDPRLVGPGAAVALGLALHGAPDRFPAPTSAPAGSSVTGGET